MCIGCGLPTSHTGTTTILLNAALPVFLVYLNTWFFSSRFCSSFKTSTFRFKRTEIVYFSLLTLLFLVLVASPYWIAWIYWRATSHTLVSLIGSIGSKFFAAGFAAVGALGYFLLYLRKGKQRLLLHFAVALFIEALFLYFLIPA